VSINSAINHLTNYQILLLLQFGRKDYYMAKNGKPSESNRSKLEVDFSRRVFIKSGGYVGIVTHQSVLRKGELMKISQYDQPV